MSDKNGRVTDRANALQHLQDDDGPGVDTGGLRDQQHRHTLENGATDGHPVTGESAHKHTKLAVRDTQYV